LEQIHSGRTCQGENQRKRKTQNETPLTLNCPISPTLNSKELHVRLHGAPLSGEISQGTIEVGEKRETKPSQQISTKLKHALHHSRHGQAPHQRTTSERGPKSKPKTQWKLPILLRNCVNKTQKQHNLSHSETK
jgi:hypothetical protein